MPYSCFNIEFFSGLFLQSVDEDHDWGYELRLVNEEEYCGKLLVLTEHKASSYHKHKKKKETFVVLCGSVLVRINGVRSTLVSGDQVTLEPGDQHSFNLAAGYPRACILEVSTHHDDSDTYRENP